MPSKGNSFSTICFFIEGPDDLDLRETPFIEDGTFTSSDLEICLEEDVGLGESGEAGFFFILPASWVRLAMEKLWKVPSIMSNAWSVFHANITTNRLASLNSQR